jgi:hypothetical protein
MKAVHVGLEECTKLSQDFAGLTQCQGNAVDESWTHKLEYPTVLWKNYLCMASEPSAIGEEGEVIPVFVGGGGGGGGGAGIVLL